jgi:hypothetical protein
LGYQLLGVGSIEEAAEPLQQASLSPVNATSAKTLLDLLEKIEMETNKSIDQ